MIRQEETPWHTRATILVDDDAAAHGGAGSYSSFERALEGGASVVDLYERLGFRYRLGLSAAGLLPLGRGLHHRNRCLDALATATMRGGAESEQPLRDRLLELDTRGSAEAALVLVTGTLTAEVAVALAHCARRYRQATVVCFPAHRFGEETTKNRWEGERRLREATGVLARARVRVAALGPDDSLAAGWSSLWRHKGAARERLWDQRPELV